MIACIHPVAGQRDVLADSCATAPSADVADEAQVAMWKSQWAHCKIRPEPFRFECPFIKEDSGIRSHATMRMLLHEPRSAGDSDAENRKPCSSSQPMLRRICA
jgi:hypothetical protein